MKIAVRSFVVVLALTGAVATTVTPSISAHTTIVAARTTAMPVASCPPNDPNACGFK